MHPPHQRLTASPVSVTSDGALRYVRFGDPSRNNSLDGATLGGLLDAVQTIATDQAARVVIFGGNGTKFSAGGDLETVRRMQTDPELPPDQRARVLRERMDLYGAVNDAVAALAPVTIAAVNRPSTVAVLNCCCHAMWGSAVDGLSSATGTSISRCCPARAVRSVFRE